MKTDGRKVPLRLLKESLEDAAMDTLCSTLKIVIIVVCVVLFLIFIEPHGG